MDIKNDSDKLVEAVEVSLIDDVIYRAYHNFFCLLHSSFLLFLFISLILLFLTKASGSSTNWSYRATFNQVYKIQIPARSSKVCNVQCTIPLDETPTVSPPYFFFLLSFILYFVYSSLNIQIHPSSPRVLHVPQNLSSYLTW